MAREKIEFYGEYLSMFAISKKIGISRETLNKYYIDTGSIYEAEKICRKIIQDKQDSLVEYEGEMLAIETIAKREGLKDAKTLKKYYEQTGDIYKAIEKCNESKFEYYNEKLTMDAIARKEGVKRDTLEVHYARTGNIYEAVSYCLKLKEQRQEAMITYNEEPRTITSIARELGISKGTLKKYYGQTGDIYRAIELYNQSLQQTEDSKVLYNEERKTVKQIAREEDVAETTLRRYLERYDNIDKAVFMAKIQRQRTRKVRIRGGNINLYDLSIILGIKCSELINLINSGISIEEIKEQRQNTEGRMKLTQELNVLPNGQTLLEYCVDKKLNYSFIYRAINTYGRTLEQAEAEYQNKGSEVPKNWIFEKYGLLLRHLMTENRVDVQRIVYYMRKEQISMSEAIEKYIVRRNAKQDGLDQDWMQEIYAVLTDKNMAEEYDEFKSAFYIDDTEEECVIRSYDEVKALERKLLLFEIAEAISNETFSSEEMPKLLQVYEIKSEEIDTIFLELYRKFDNGVMLGENESEMKRRKVLNDIIKKWYYLGKEERENITTENAFTNEEIQRIIELSGKIIKYRNMLKTQKQDKIFGEN